MLWVCYSVLFNDKLAVHIVSDTGIAPWCKYKKLIITLFYMSLQLSIHTYILHKAGRKKSRRETHSLLLLYCGKELLHIVSTTNI